jgi:hypothetical protein
MQARSSGGEHHLDAVRVWGSNPHAPTMPGKRSFPPPSPLKIGGISIDEFQRVAGLIPGFQ